MPPVVSLLVSEYSTYFSCILCSILHAEAEAAISSLDGRWFGGRVIKADLYDQSKFDNNDLSHWRYVLVFSLLFNLLPFFGVPLLTYGCTYIRTCVCVYVFYDVSVTWHWHHFFYVVLIICSCAECFNITTLWINWFWSRVHDYLKLLGVHYCRCVTVCRNTWWAVALSKKWISV